jgi:predicted glycogen debranching enzyme
VTADIVAPRVQFDAGVCRDPAQCLRREWLETNAIGGFACATIAGANTRRYHGLLTAAIKPPVARCLLLSKLEETLVIGTERFELSSNLYEGCIYPEGYRYLNGFRLDPFPIFTFQAGGVKVEKRILLVPGENTLIAEYETDAPGCGLELRPLIAFRGYHDLTHRNDALNDSLDEGNGVVSIQPYSDLPRLYFAHDAKALRMEKNWYFNFEYPVERERGLDCLEDLFCPFVLEYDLTPDRTASVIASTNSYDAGDAVALKRKRIGKTPEDPLVTATAQFIVARGKFRTIIAGYPWFSDWGRDTMISLPGLTLATGEFGMARDILRAFAATLDRGMLPNRFPDSGEEPEYNTVDATLWFFEAVRKYLEYTNDTEFVRGQLYDKLKDIIEWHSRGTRFGIHADADGLLAAGDPTTQLTWMDARVDGRPVTPRSGKPVEIQALWYNALRFLAKLAEDLGDSGASYQALATTVAKNFNSSFWNEAAGCLYDVIDGDLRDDSLRPNQVIALSLGYCAVPEARARKILETVERHLLTPFGLRTLAPADPRYRGRYEGPPHDRDAAYHQGTVWPWLLGPFITAQVRFNGEAGRNRAVGLVDALRAWVESRGVGQLAEIFDGDAPHEPRGCFAQAWSVAEVLRVCREHLQ